MKWSMKARAISAIKTNSDIHQNNETLQINGNGEREEKKKTQYALLFKISL